MMPADQSRFLRPALAVGAALGAAWAFHSQWIAPLSLRAQDSVRKSAELRERLGSAVETVREVKACEQELGKARTALGRLLGDCPRESVMVALPERVRQHFAQFGLPLGVIRLNATQDTPGLPGYQRVFWSMALPVSESDRNATGLLLAVAELEERNRFIKVLDVSLQPDAEDPLQRTAGINFMAVLPK